MCANSESSVETVWMRKLAWGFAGRLCDKYHNSWAGSINVQHRGNTISPTCADEGARTVQSGRPRRITAFDQAVTVNDTYFLWTELISLFEW